MILARPCIGRLTSGYGRRKHPITGEMTGHHGVDIAPRAQDLGIVNIPIYAMADGTVIKRYSTGQFGTYGNCLILRHVVNGKQYETLYAHLKSFNVKNGQKVKQGQQIAVMGNTGGSTGRHLHVEVHRPRWVNTYIYEQNPLSYFTMTPSLGAIGDDVKEIQQLLKNRGYNIAVDGHFGVSTDKAVKDFQKKSELTVDGYVGETTLKLLKQSEGELTMSQYEELKKEIEALKNHLGSDRPVSPTFKDSWKWAEEKGLMDGSNPSRPISREQFATVLNRYSESNSLSPTTKKDLKELFENLYEDKLFLENHADKVDSMPEYEIVNKLASVLNRFYKDYRKEE